MYVCVYVYVYVYEYVFVCMPFGLDSLTSNASGGHGWGILWRPWLGDLYLIQAGSLRLLRLPFELIQHVLYVKGLGAITDKPLVV